MSRGTLVGEDATRELPVIANIDLGRPTGILVIEDERLLLKAMTQGLRNRGFVVWTAQDGGEGVDLYQRFWAQIDVVLSDVQMPVLDGPKTLEALRKINPLVRCCFMTGDTRQSTSNSLLRRGALRVFAKPFSSVAQVADELRELATNPDVFANGREASGHDSKQALAQPEEKRTGGGLFERLVALLREI